MNTDNTIPVEASLDGKRNAFYTHCSVVGHTRPYAVCLHLCQERKGGRLDSVYSECSAAINKRECPALHMRKEEQAAGHAIYFIERIRVVANMVEKAAAFVMQVVKVTEPPPETLKSTTAGIHPRREKSLLDRIDDTGYAKAITRAVEKEAKPKVEVVAPPPVVEPKAGESLLEMARRLMGK